jgi:protein-disulfide isomerase
VYLVIMLAILRNPCALCLTLDAILVTQVWIDSRGETTPLFPSTGPQLFTALMMGFLVLPFGAGISWGVPAAFAKSHHWNLRALRFDPASLPVENISPPPAGTLWIGDPKAAITILFAQDPKCVYCRESFANLTRVTQSLSKSVRIGILNYPADGDCNPTLDLPGHRGACAGSRILLCKAGGRLSSPRPNSEFMTALYESQTVFFANSDEVAPSIAREWGLPEASVRECLRDSILTEQLQGQIHWLTERQIAGTPTVWVNGRRYDGLLTEAGWARILGL